MMSRKPLANKANEDGREEKRVTQKGKCDQLTWLDLYT
jgi:hypothetical protein